jgi:undecaprenyl-diphosphatase
MDPVKAVVLGVVQGLTEFFPVSSSGHLVIFQHLFGMTEPALLFDVCVHVGTLLAVSVYFYRDVWAIAGAPFRFIPKALKDGAREAAADGGEPLRMVLLIIAGSLPTALLGFGFHQVAGSMFASLPIVGSALLVTTALLVGTRYTGARNRQIIAFSVWSALIVGTAQGLAVIPGISRSGATIAACLMMGLTRDAAARFSFLLAIPAILGALALSAASGPEAWGEYSAAAIALGTCTSAVVGYLALAGLIRIVRRGQLSYFAPYCLALGVLTLVLAL